MGDRASPEGPSVTLGPWAYVLQNVTEKMVFVAKIDLVCEFLLFSLALAKKIARSARSLFSYSKGEQRRLIINVYVDQIFFKLKGLLHQNFKFLPTERKFV